MASTVRPLRSAILACSSSSKMYLGRPVDLVAEKALRAELRPYVEKEAIDV